MKFPKQAEFVRYVVVYAECREYPSRSLCYQLFEREPDAWQRVKELERVTGREYVVLPIGERVRKGGPAVRGSSRTGAVWFKGSEEARKVLGRL